MGQIILIWKLVGSCCKAEIGSTVYHIQTKGDIITKQGLKMISVFAHIDPFELILPPMSQPPRINLTTHY